MVNKLVKAAMGGKQKKQPIAAKVPAPKGRPLEEASNVRTSKGKSGMDDERMYRAKAALETLTRAEEIRKDRQLMKDVQAHAASHKASIDQALSGSVKMGRKR